MKQALVDTDTVSFYFRRHPVVVARLDKYLLEYGYVNLSVVTYYEVLNGLYYKDARKQLSTFETFVDANRVLSLNQSVAQCAAEQFAELRKKGQVIGHNDVLIAATALTYDLILVTNNTNHFDRIDGLSIDNWSL